MRNVFALSTNEKTSLKVGKQQKNIINSFLFCMSLFKLLLKANASLEYSRNVTLYIPHEGFMVTVMEMELV